MDRIQVGVAALLLFVASVPGQERPAPQVTGTKPLPGTPDIFNRLPVKRVVLTKMASDISSIWEAFMTITTLRFRLPQDN